MNPIRLARLIRRVAVILAGLTGSLLALSTRSPATFAYVLPPHPTGGTVGPPPVHTIVTGGMPGWQITLIAVAVAISPPRGQSSLTGPGQPGGTRPQPAHDRPPPARPQL